MIHIATKLPILHYEVFYIAKSQSVSHPDARFLCLLNGSLQIEADNTSYKMTGGDILFLTFETEYHLQVKNPSLVLFVCIHPYFLLNTFGYSDFSIQPFYSDAQPVVKASMNAYIADLIAQYLNQADNTCGIYAKTYELFNFISQHCMTAHTDPDHKPAEKIAQLELFLGKHYMEAVSLGDAADVLHYTPQYLSGFLKKHCGKTFQEYLNTFRLKAAKILLRYSEESTARIAFLCGFPNQSSFIKYFEKEYGQTPDAYLCANRFCDRRDSKIEGIPVTDSALIRDYIFNYMNYSAAPESMHTQNHIEQVVISDWNPRPFSRIWNFLINMGSARDFEKPTFRHHLAQLQNDLHFQYGRCTELFTLVKVYTIEQNTTYDFSRIFQIIDFLLSIRLKPFFDIDCKPFRLYKDPEDTFDDYATYLSAQSYDEFLFRILPEFTRVCIFRYGFEEFSSWKFELWRRYNINMTSLESPEDYCARFQKTAAVLKSLVPGVSLGGPGFNGFLGTSKLREILKAFSGARYQPDFISAYYFPYTAVYKKTDHTVSGYGASSTPDTMVEKINEWYAVLPECGFSDTPLYITEYSAHLSLENYMNDSMYPAVYIFHQSLQNIRHVDGLGYWLASDLSLSYGRPNAPLFGGNGLLTKNGIKKPSYYAYEFLNRLGSGLLSRGKHYIVTYAFDSSIQILVYHFGILKQSFADAPLNQELLHYPYSAFEDSTPVEIQFTLKNIPGGSYRTKELILDLNHGNVLTSWSKLNHIQNVGRDEIRYLSFESIPSMTIHTEEIRDTYTIRTILSHNEAKLIILQPYH